MKGVILAGGKGTRLGTSTKVTNKHLLPIYDKPMIDYPLQTLLSAGITKILIVTGTDHIGAIISYLGSGKSYEAEFTYRVQDAAGGIAQALALAEDFANSEPIICILGDNIFYDNFSETLKKTINTFSTGAKIFLAKTDEAKRFGVAETKDGKVVSIEEKPKFPKSNLAVTGLYIYDTSVFEIIKNLKPSARGELEITDVNNEYIRQGKMNYDALEGWWSDAGTPETLYRNWEFARKQRTKF